MDDTQTTSDPQIVDERDTMNWAWVDEFSGIEEDNNDSNGGS